MEKIRKKPVIVYLHRYPIEYETNLFPTASEVLELLSKKYEIVYISLRPSKEKNPSLRKYIKTDELPFSINVSEGKDKWIKTFLWLLFLPKVYFKVRKINPSLIICKEVLPFYPSILGRTGYPMMIEATDWWLSGFLYHNKIGSYIARHTEMLQIRDWRRLNSFVVTHSQAECNFITSCGFPKERTRVFHYPLFEEVYRPLSKNKLSLRKELSLPQKSFIVAIHGAILPSKGYEQLLGWWKEAIKDHSDWTLLIIGGAGGEKWCREEIKRLNIEKNVIMTGYLPTHEDVNKNLNAADCLLITRRNTPDNQGQTPSALFHSLSVGKPTVATGLPGMSEVIENNKSGYLFKPDNYNSFKLILEEIESNPKKAVQIGKKGIKRGKVFFNPQKSINGFINAVESTIKYFSKNK